jgi:hypothetical protein
MTVSDVWDDIPVEEYVPEGGTKFYYLVCYDTSTGEWEIDEDAIFLPEAPIYDPKIDRWRKMHFDEINRDSELIKVLKATVKRMGDV